MQGRANQKYNLFALLPLLIIAAALWGDVHKNAKAVIDKAPLCLLKTVAPSQHDVPFLSSNVPKISRAEYRSPQNSAITVYEIIAPPGLNIYNKGRVVFASCSYSSSFKTLFPEHEFS